MPELPEVETVRRGGARILTGRKVTRVELRRHDLRWPIPVDAVMGLKGRKCTGIDRRSKYLLMRFDGSSHGQNSPTAIVHLGMSGRLWVDEVGKGREPDWLKHEHWRMRFGDRLLRYEDARRFGSLDVASADDIDTHPLLLILGPEPLGPEFTPEYLFAASRKRKTAIKTFIMDSKQVVGVGNIYASESCFRAGVRPRRRAGSITQYESKQLANSIRTVLEDAIKAGGTSLKDYVSMEHEAGYFQRALSVYDREGDACDACGSIIKRTTDGGRSTYYCPGCQK